MKNEVIGTETQRPFDFAAKSLNRFLQEKSCCARQIDQVVDVNGQRLEVIFFAKATHLGTLVTAELVGLPLPRTSGKNLEGIAAQTVGALRGILHATSDRGVNADPPRSPAWQAFRWREPENVLLASHGTGHRSSITRAERETLQATSLQRAWTELSVAGCFWLRLQNGGPRPWLLQSR